MKSNNFSFSNLVSVCLLLISLTAAFFALSRTFRVKAVAKAEANASVDVQKLFVTKNIEDIRIGERTLGTNPQGRVADELDDSIFETVPFCKYSLRTAKEDGSQCDIQLLRPANWLDNEITRLRRKIDGKIVDEVDLLADSLLLGELNSSDNYAFDVWLELPEMGVVGWATLTNVDENVVVQNGAGNVVTGTFAHIADNAIDLIVEDQEELIACTDNHPFWSVDRQVFIPAGELIEGERLLLYNGETKRVVQKLPRPGPQVVYNLEIYGEHVYHVTPDGVLVHNACPHEHHVVMKGNFSHWRKENRDYVINAQNLIDRYGISINDPRNLLDNVMNEGHTVRYAKKVYEQLKRAEDSKIGQPYHEIAKSVEDKLKEIRNEIGIHGIVGWTNLP